MKKVKRILSAAMALSIVAGLTACDKTSSDPANETEATTTTTAVTVAINDAALLDDEVEVLDQVATQLQDVELENKTIKWLAHYDINPGTEGKSKSVALELFETKYGGKVVWYPTTWEQRYTDLSSMVLGGEGIDIFPGDDTANYPKGINSGMFQPVDDYIDMNSPLWQRNAAAMELYAFGGKHYEMITNVTAECVVIYDKSTIESCGLDDPYTLWKEGNWNWDTMKEMLLEYVDEDADQWGLDGFWAEKSLFVSAGVPIIQTTPEGLKCNVNDATVEKAMNYQYDLYTNGLVFPREQFAWTTHPEFMGEGRQLLYFCGAWCIESAPETWTTTIDPANVAMVPVPSPAGSVQYQGATLDGFAICKGAQNPKGAALYAECEILEAIDENAIAIVDRKKMDDAKWSAELIATYKEINELARLNPVVDLASGCSTDIASITTDGGDTIGTRAALHGVEWTTMREMIADTLLTLVNDVDTELKTKMAE